MAHPGPIEFGYYVPRYNKYTDPSAWAQLAQTVEAAGFTSLWRDDHLVMPANADPQNYEYGTPDWLDPNTAWCEVFVTLAYLAAHTDEARLGTNICIVPLRNPLLLVKQVFTLDAISDGRFDLGVGVGWLESEFDRLDAPFATRGPVTDEFLDILEAAKDGVTAFDGDFTAFAETGFHPVPDGDGPAIWVGGRSRPAFRRTAEYGDGWTITGMGPDGVADARDRIRQAWADFDRSGDPLIQVRQRVAFDSTIDHSAGGVVGPTETIKARIQAFREAGMTHFIMRSTVDSLSDEIDQLERFGDEIISTIS